MYLRKGEERKIIFELDYQWFHTINQSIYVQVEKKNNVRPIQGELEEKSCWCSLIHIGLIGIFFIRFWICSMLLYLVALRIHRKQQIKYQNCI